MTISKKEKSHYRDHFPKKVAYNKLNEQQKEIVDNFKGATLASLTKSTIDMSVEREKNLLKFKRTFVVFVQKCFLLPTTFPYPEADDAPEPPWLAYWTQRRLFGRITLETRTCEKSRIKRGGGGGVGGIEDKKGKKKEKKKKEKTKLFSIAMALPISLVEEIKQQKTFTSMPLEIQTEEASLNDCFPKPQYQAYEETSARQSEQEAPPECACEKTSTRQSEQEAPLNISSCPRHWEDDAPSFNLSISFPTSQSIVTQLEC
ncbi:hypothetical protein AHAS_Ahas11G0247100 [Arachis hypogaea]